MTYTTDEEPTVTNVYGVNPPRLFLNESYQANENKKYGMTPIPGSDPDEPYFGRVTGRERLLNGLDTLFNTGGGERLMMPDFGLDLKWNLFEPLDSVIIGEIRGDILNQIETYFGDEINIISLDVSISENSKYQGMPAVLIQLRAEEVEGSEIIDLTTEV